MILTKHKMETMIDALKRDENILRSRLDSGPHLPETEERANYLKDYREKFEAVLKYMFH